MRKNQVLKKAEDICNDIIYFNRTWDMEGDNKPVKFSWNNWSQKQNNDDEWTYMLNRMEYLNDLVLAYKITKKDKYQTKCIFIINKWILNNVNLEKKYHRTLDTGIRLLNWNYVLNQLDIDNDEIKKSIINQINYLTINYRIKDNLSNWGILQTIGVLCSRDIFDNALVKWWEEKLKIQLEIQINEDGWHWEHSIMYHNQVLLGLCRLQLTYPAYDLISIIDQMAECTYSLCRPDYYQIQQGDSDRTDVSSLLALAASITENKKYNLQPVDFETALYIEKRLLPFQELGEVKKLYSASGISIYRQNELYLTVHNQPYGSSHSHLMWGHINFYNQIDILIDPGRYTYRNCRERTQLKSLSAHNCAINITRYQEQILNSWDTKVNAQKIGITQQSKDQIVVTIVDFKVKEEHYQRQVILIEEQLLIFDDIPFACGEEINANLVINPQIKINDEFRFSNGYYLSHNYDKIAVEKQIYSEHYNELQITNRIKFISNCKQIMYYHALLTSGATITKIEDDGDAISYRLQTSSASYIVYLAPKEIQIGTKVKKVEDYFLYGKLVIIDELNNEIYHWIE